MPVQVEVLGRMRKANSTAVSLWRKRGFSLVEILVVLGVVALLAAILFPAFGRVRAGARRASCASNLKQIGLAMTLYAQDYRVFPNYANYAQINDKICSVWATKIFPYVKNESIFQCPSSPLGIYKSECPATDLENPLQPMSWGGSYDINLPYSSYHRDPDTGTIKKSYRPEKHVSLTAYIRPSSTILVLDGDGDLVSPGYQEPTATDVETLKTYGVDAHHEGGLNVAFADGHVKYMSMEALLKRSLWRLNGPE
jgi:prepilin-type N-terminal cleavage/methylation domain-containing protein/prepilin-type processing-associated H-X9-DG protein